MNAIAPTPVFFGVDLGPHPDVTAIMQHCLTWFPELGYGYFECAQETVGDVYDAAYFERYADQADTPLGRRLMASRVELVKRHVGDMALRLKPCLDVGIGCGAFVEALEETGNESRGYDVNPAGIAWLESREIFGDLYARPWPIVTFWDALEHIREPAKALAQCEDWVFVALPIFRDADHVLASKHYRKDEHYHYWTRDGFRRFAGACGFDVVDLVATETALGRDDVETFVLRRRHASGARTA
ncbi:MAG: methyltransferase domain-containing protein [Phenylobacterium sp.]|nr:methyltransferase domain-containing protein [Phenylobacterium sp.]